MDLIIFVVTLVTVVLLLWAFGPELDQAFMPTRRCLATVARVEMEPVSVPPSGAEAELPTGMANMRVAHIRVVDLDLDDGGSGQFAGQPPTLLSPLERVRCTYRIGRTGRRYICTVEKLSPADA